MTTAFRSPDNDNTAFPSPVAPPHLDTVAGALRTRMVRVPAWFTVAQAARVADLRSVGHVLVEEHGRVRGSLSRAELTRARSTDPLARWMRRTDLVIAATAPRRQAVACMKAHGVTCLPVVSGGMLVGTIALEDAEATADAA